MASDTGKGFEKIFENLVKANGGNAVRFYDTMLGYKKVDNPADFIISIDKNKPSILIECKETHKSSFSLSKAPQLERLQELPRFRSYLVIWFVEYKLIVAYDASEVYLGSKEGIKSINPNKTKFKSKILSREEDFNRVKPKNININLLWEE